MIHSTGLTDLVSPTSPRGGQALLKYVPGQGAFKTFSRSGTARYFDGSVIQEAADGVLRDSHYVRLPSGVLVRTTLLEASRTNLFTRSGELGHAAWTTAGSDVTVSSDDAEAPDGTTTAEKLADNDDSTNDASYIRQDPTLSDDTDYTFSVYAKAGDVNFVALLVKDKAGTSHRTWFDLSDGSIGTEQGSPTSRISSHKINGYWRCSITVDSASGGTTPECRIYIADADGDSTTDDGVYIHVWGAQLEAGSFASSYIPTTSAPLSRSADSLYLPFTAPPQEMTVQVKFVELGSGFQGLGGGNVFFVGTGASSPKLELESVASEGNYRFFYDNGSATSFSAATTNHEIGDTVVPRCTLSPAGAPQMHASVNGGAEVSGGIGGARAFPAAWSGQRVYLNSDGTGNVGYIALIYLKVARGNRPAAYMEAL